MSRRLLILLIILFITSCAPQTKPRAEDLVAAAQASGAVPTRVPTRVPHRPGDLVEYQVQSGDTLPALAARFNTTLADLLAANPEVPPQVTTLPPGYPLQVPAYFPTLRGPSFKILPDSEFVYGPTLADFKIREELLSRPGYLSRLNAWAYKRNRPSWEVIEVVARTYSINPRLLLALLEYQTRALSNPFPTSADTTYPLQYVSRWEGGLFLQLNWAAQVLNDAYYGWRAGTLRELELADGLIQRPDPYQNAATVAVQALFARLYGLNDFNMVVNIDGFYQTYRSLWGDPFSYEVVLIPTDLRQPEMALPFTGLSAWHYTGGPHSTWGSGLPYGGIDFAPPASSSGCGTASTSYATAVADGVIARSGEATVMLDLDGDGDEGTGWVVLYFHLDSSDLVPVGTEVKRGDPLGRPSCEGGRASGNNVHLGRRYNGEWLPANEIYPWTMSGWLVRPGAQPYEGTLVRSSEVVVACKCGNDGTRIKAAPPQ